MTNRLFKDSLFKFIFGRNDDESKKRLLSLYNALSGSNHTDINALELTTIENVIYVTWKNDISFLIEDETYLLEQQSSFNPNMPLRGMIYFAELYGKYLAKKDLDLYGEKLIKLPSPRFYVLYNGKTEKPDEMRLRLSDSFAKSAEGFEWSATMLNINEGHSTKILNACESLQDYSKYVKMVREEIESGKSIDEATDRAVDEAIKQNLLDGFFKTHKAEVLSMILTEFDQEQYDRNRRREGYEEGIAIGEKKGIAIGEKRGMQQGVQQTRIETARNMLKDGLPSDLIMKYTGISAQNLAKL